MTIALSAILFRVAILFQAPKAAAALLAVHNNAAWSANVSSHL